MVVVQPCVPTQCGKAFRESLHKPSPVPAACRLRRRKRVVPAFTIQAMQRNTKVLPPPKCNIYEQQPTKPTMFKACYLRGEFPITIEYGFGGKRLCWKVPIEKLDYHHYLPVFFEGLAEGDYPFSYFVDQGIKDLVSKASYKVLPVVPQLIIPIKKALATKRPSVICNTLRALQRLVSSCDQVGEALVPYFRQILPVINLFKGRNRNLGAGVDHSASSGGNIGDLIEETLQVLERYGGVDAFINIKYMVPTYESCVLN